MVDSFVEETHEGWFSRIIESIKGVLVGIVLFFVAIGVLFWNEGRAVKRAQDLAEGKAGTVEVKAEAVDAAREGQLVHTTGLATTDEVLQDDAFGVSAQALRLSRSVELFQWIEKKKTKSKKKLGGGKKKTTEYTYETGWSSSLQRSSEFKEPEGHQNPTEMHYDSETFTASSATLGAYKLSGSVVRQISGGQPLAPEALPTVAGAPGQVKLTPTGLYIGANPQTPAVGDYRIRFEQLPPTEISVVAKQAGGTLDTYTTSRGGTLLLVQNGTVTKDAMFQAAEDANAMLTWLLRFGGWLAMTIGLSLIFKPISVVADVVPFIGGIVGLGFALAAAGIASVVSLLTIAVGWLFYRPLIGIPLVLLAVGILVGLIVMGNSKASAKGA